MKDKKHMITTIDVEKAFEKNSTFFMIKSTNQAEKECTSSQ